MNDTSQHAPQRGAARTVAGRDAAGGERWARPPRWFDLLALVGPVMLATVGTYGLLLAILGVYRGWMALALGVPTGAALLAGAWRAMPAGPPAGLRTATGAGAGAALVLAVGYLVFAAAVPSQNVVASRDPGVYLNTARWLEVEGDLDADAAPPAFDGVDGLRFDSAGVYNMGDGRLEFQFSHLSSVVLSVGYEVGGFRGMFRVPALASAAGLLALYSVAVRALRRPGVALVAPVLMAVCLPLLYVSRNTYSEPFTLALLWGTGLALADLHRRPRLTMALVGGATLGALVSTRIDGLLYVALLFPLAAVSVMASEAGSARRARARAWALAAATAALFGVVGVIDLLEWSGVYVDALSSQLKMLQAALAASAFVSAVTVLAWWRLPSLRRLAGRWRAPAAAIVSALVVAVISAGWLLRPVIETSHGRQPNEVVERLQELQGLAVEPTRNYAEQSLRWMEWYLGTPALVSAIVGLGVVAYLAVRRGTTGAALGVFTLTVVSGALYWWDPSITPDHLWASRRFVPAVLPGLAVMAAVPLAGIHGLLRRPWRVPVVAALALALVVPPAATTWPLRMQRSQAGYLHPVQSACEMLPDDAAVILVGGFAWATLSQTLRSWCQVPVAGEGASATSAVEPDTLEGIARTVADNGHTLVLVAADSRDLVDLAEVVGDSPRPTNAAEDRWTPEPTLDRAPEDYLAPEAALPVEFPFRLHVLVVDAG